MTRDDVLSYAEKPPRISRLAIVALAASILSAVGFFLVVPTIVAFVLGLLAKSRIQRNPVGLGGLGLATAAITISWSSFCLMWIVVLLLPSRGGHGPAGRSYCAANLRGIVQSMVVYSAENNDAFPVMTYANYSPALNSPTASAVAGTPDDVQKRYYKPPDPQAGSVTAAMWMLVLRNSTSPKQFICRSDPTLTSVAQLHAPSPATDFYDNFQNDTQLSYSVAYPWKADGTVGKWWTNTVDSSLPLMADMAPLQGTGTPPRNLTTAFPGGKAWNSGNHQGDGQNVAFADAHTEFTRRPDIGQDTDNIWTTSARPSLGPASTGGLPALPLSPMLTRDAPPFDIILYPVRNLTTGRL